jgi:beta-phosphoglucomutase
MSFSTTDNPAVPPRHATLRGMLQAIVFDFDGVLVDSEPMHFAAIRDVAGELGVELDEKLYHRVFIGFDDRDSFRALLSMRAGGPPDHNAIDPSREAEVHRLCERKQEVFDRASAAGVEPLPGVRELLDDLAGELPLAIASGATRRDIDGILHGLGWRHRFETIVTADDVARSKPDPQTYALAVSRLAERSSSGVLPSSTLAIEDTATGLASAKSAGLRTLAVCTTSPASSLQAAERIAPSLEGVTRERLGQWFE